MSRIGKKPIEVPVGVKITISDGRVSITGPLGTLAMPHRPEVAVRWEESERAVVVSIDPADREKPEVRAYWGLTRALIRNMIEGVTKGYEKTMEVVGVGWNAAVQGESLKLVVGFANPIVMPIPAGLAVKVEKNIVNIRGADKQLVGQFAAEMRAKRKPEPYNGKGIKYSTEVIRRKQGKQFGAGA